MDKTQMELARLTMEHALRRGADEAAVRVSEARFVELKQRQGCIETLRSSTSRGLSLELFVDRRYSSNATSLLQPERVKSFVQTCLDMTRALVRDPFRALPDPSLYGPTSGVDLQLSDPGYDTLEMDRRMQMTAAMEQAAQGAGSEVISVTAGLVSQISRTLQLHSNGFRGEHEGTAFYMGATVTAREEDGRRPEDAFWTAARHLTDLPRPDEVGREAGRRALARVGSGKVASGRRTMVVENRAAVRLVASLVSPLHAAALQQRRSCFEGRLGDLVASPQLALVDDPLLVRGLGSRTHDGEGLAARRLPLVEQGRLQSYFIDVYYGRKLGLAPTTGGASNLILKPGTMSLDEMVSSVAEGILVTGFLGGNANPATGELSYGVFGFEIEKGQLGRPVSEMNITDNHTSLWTRLEAAGSDPYPYSSWRIPSLRFADVQFSGA